MSEKIIKQPIIMYFKLSKYLYLKGFNNNFVRPQIIFSKCTSAISLLYQSTSTLLRGGPKVKLSTKWSHLS
jgi:hypothetical protein